MSVRYRVSITQGAEGDLEAIYDYVCEHRSPEEAAALLDRLLEKLSMLETFPLRGSVPRELETLGMAEFRQILLAPYRLIHRVVGETVFIVVIADGRRDMQALLERRLLRP